MRLLSTAPFYTYTVECSTVDSERQNTFSCVFVTFRETSYLCLFLHIHTHIHKHIYIITQTIFIRFIWFLVQYHSSHLVTCDYIAIILILLLYIFCFHQIYNVLAVVLIFQTIINSITYKTMIIYIFVDTIIQLMITKSTNLVLVSFCISNLSPDFNIPPWASS